MANRKKGKRRNSEKRKEKSRDAARSRRTKECEIFNDLADQLPVGSSQLQQLDKASIIRVAISHLKLRRLLGPADTTLNNKSNDLQKKLDSQYEKALDGFVLVIASEGDIMFLSEDVSKYLGITQIELIGQNIYDFTHPCDHDEIQEILLDKGKATDKTHEDRNFLMRMKCTLTSKGRNVNLKSANYKVVRCTGRYVSVGADSAPFPSYNEDSKTCMILIAEVIAHPSNIEVPLDSQTFVSRHSLDMRFTQCDHRVRDLLGYSSQRLINESLFDYHHAMDSRYIREACKDLFSKGQSLMTNYRFLASGGGYCRMRTEATIINNQRTDRPQYVICVNYLISGIEDEDVILSPVQEPHVEEPAVPVLPSGIMLSTETIFAPRPKEEYTDMLQFTDMDGNLQMLNDLLELAPSAGTVLMDFDDNDGNDSYVQELTPGPFERYNDQQKLSAPPQTTTDMRVLNLTSYDNGSAEVDQSGFCSDVSSQQTVDHYACTPETTLSDNIDDMDFDLRAPYIPMDGSDDQLFDNNWVPQVDEDMLNSRMIGITESVFEPKPPEPKEVPNTHNKTPLSILRLQASRDIKLPGGDIARNAGPPKMKRPMETNRLETGPPKQSRTEGPLVYNQPIISVTNSGSNPEAHVPTIQDIMKNTPCTSGSSVLMNLLTKGEDTNFGYRVPDSKPIGEVFQKGAESLRGLMLSSDDEDSDVIELYDASDEDTSASSQGFQALSKSQPMNSVLMATKTQAPTQVAAPTATVTSFPQVAAPTAATSLTNNNHPASQANLVVIRTNNTVLFAPIPPQRNNKPQIINVKYN